MTMRVVEYVPHGVLILEIGSRSRPGRKSHYLSVVYDEAGGVTELSCSCEAALYGKKCHHLDAAEDLIGRVT